MGGLEAEIFSLKNEDSETQIVKLAIQLYFVIVLVLFQALKALDQLHDVNVTTRTERFILSCLEQGNMQEKGTKSPVRTVFSVSYKNLFNTFIMCDFCLV